MLMVATVCWPGSREVGPSVPETVNVPIKKVQGHHYGVSSSKFTVLLLLSPADKNFTQWFSYGNILRLIVKTFANLICKPCSKVSLQIYYEIIYFYATV